MFSENELYDNEWGFFVEMDPELKRVPALRQISRGPNHLSCIGEEVTYYDKLLNLLDQNSERVKDHFIHIKNPYDGKTYIADPVYYAYFLMLKEIWEELPLEIRENTYNLTKAGILNLNELRSINIQEYMNDSVESITH